MPKPLPYSEKTIKAFFSDSTYTSSKAFNPIGQRLDAIEKLKAEKEESIKNNNPYDAKKEIEYQRKLSKAYKDLKEIADAYVKYKDGKLQKELTSAEGSKGLSEKEEARYSAAKKIRAFAAVNENNCTEQIENLLPFNQLGSEAMERFRSNEEDSLNKLNSTTLYWELDQIKKDSENVEIKETYYGQDYKDKRTNTVYAYRSKRPGYSRAEIWPLAEKYGPAPDTKGAPFKTPGKNDLYFNEVIDNYKLVANNLKKDFSNPLLMDEADKLADDASLQKFVIARVRAYNFKVKHTNFGDKTPLKKVDLPKEGPNFFKELAENVKDNPEAEGLADLVNAVNDVKAASAAARANNEKYQGLGKYASHEARNKYVGKLRSLNKEIDKLKYEEMKKDENVKQEKVEETEGFEKVEKLKFTRKIGDKNVSVTVKEADLKNGLSNRMKAFVEAYTPDKEKVSAYLQENKFNPFEELPKIGKYAKLLTENLEKDPDNTKKLFQGMDLYEKKELRETVKSAVEYLNAVNKYSGNEKVQIQLPMDKSNIDYEALSTQLKGMKGDEALAEFANTMAGFAKVVKPLRERHFAKQSYDLSKDFFKKYIDKSMFPSDQFKAMRTEFNKLENRLDLPDADDRKAAFQSLYNAACEYMRFKDPKLNKVPGAKLSEYEQSRVDFAQKLREFCVKEGADKTAYTYKMEFADYDKQKGFEEKPKTEEKQNAVIQ